MFTPTGSFSGFSINDVEAARTFYNDTLGLRTDVNDMGFLEITLPGGARVLAYLKPDHVPATFTVLNFEVNDVESAVDDLAKLGIAMTLYPQMPHDSKGIMRGNGPDIAWFTDPSGNVISVLSAS